MNSHCTRLPKSLGKRFLLSLLVSSLIVALLIAPTSSAQINSIIHVVPGGAGARNGADWANAKDLQDALASATDGDQVWVKAEPIL
jgi:hypothetical protein